MQMKQQDSSSALETVARSVVEHGQPTQRADERDAVVELTRQRSALEDRFAAAEDRAERETALRRRAEGQVRQLAASVVQIVLQMDELGDVAAALEGPRTEGAFSIVASVLDETPLTDGQRARLAAAARHLEFDGA